MDDRTKYILLFIGGVIWAMKSAKKAYAPPLNNSTLLPKNNVEPIDCKGTNPPCPKGCKKFQRSSGVQQVYHRPICLSLEDYDKETKKQQRKVDRLMDKVRLNMFTPHI